MHTSPFCGLVLTALVTTGAHAQLLETRPFAQASPGADSKPSLLNSADDDWHIAISPYMWFTGFSGEVTQQGVSFDVDDRFYDLYDNSNDILGLMGAVDVEFKRFVFQINGAYAGAEFDRERSGSHNDVLADDFQLSATWVEGFGGYRFFEHESDESAVYFDGFVGVRGTWIDTESTLSASATVTLPNGTVLNPGDTQQAEQSESWVEPFIGTRFGFGFAEHWRAVLRGDIGGFGIDGSQFSWQTAALLGYEWNFKSWEMSLYGGYRALGQDYSNGDFGWNMITHGPVLGLQFTFSF